MSERPWNERIGWPDLDRAEVALDRLAARVRLTELDRRLGQRERQVLVAAAAGLTTQETAELLGLSVHTCFQYRKRLLRALEAKSMPQAVAIGFRVGLLG